MSALPQLMKYVSLRKVCAAVEKNEIFTLQRGVEMATDANKRLAPSPEAFKANQSTLAKAKELLDMKESVLREEARLRELIVERERLLTQRPPEQFIKAKKLELAAITRFVSEYQRFRRSCKTPQGFNPRFPYANQHRCEDCAIDQECDQEDGPFFKKKCSTAKNPRGSLELHLSDKVYYYLVEADEIIVIDRESLIDHVESSVSCIETEISDILSESVISESMISESGMSVSDTDSEHTVKAAESSNTGCYSHSYCEFFDLEKLTTLIDESRQADIRLDYYRKHIIQMYHLHKAEEEMFRQTTEKLMNRYGLSQPRPSERLTRCKNSTKFAPVFTASNTMPRSTNFAPVFAASNPMPRSYDDCRRGMPTRPVAQHNSACESCCLRKLMDDQCRAQRSCTSSYSDSARSPAQWSTRPATTPQDLHSVSNYLQRALFPGATPKRGHF